MGTREDIVAKVQGLYKKNEKMSRAIGVGSAIVKEYTASDGVPLPEGNIIRETLQLPCLPFNKVFQGAGKPDVGKSTCAGETMAAAQKAGFEIVFWETEGKFDANRYKAEFKGDPDRIYLIQTNEIRVGGQLVKDYVNAIKASDPDAKILIVQDSVGGGLGRNNTERNLADEKSGQPGQEAKENGEVIRHWVGLFNKYPDSISIILINQTYAKIGFMQKGDKAKGGDGIEFFSSFIVFFKRVKTLTKVIKGKKMKEGIITRATVTKNHLTRGKFSVYQMDFKITASGTSVIDTPISDEEVEDDQE